MLVNELVLPESLEKFVEREIAEGGYGSAERYLRHLISVEHKRRAKERLEALMEEGRNSGNPEEVTQEWWAELRAEVNQDTKA